MVSRKRFCHVAEKARPLFAASKRFSSVPRGGGDIAFLHPSVGHVDSHFPAWYYIQAGPPFHRGEE